MYDSAKSCVAMNVFYLIIFPALIIGVRQGENLCPLLFSHYLGLNDLHDVLQEAPMGLTQRKNLATNTLYENICVLLKLCILLNYGN